MTTTGMQRKPGVQVRLVAGSPTASRHSHLNPGFKVVFARIAMAEDAFMRVRNGPHIPVRTVRWKAKYMKPVRECGFFIDCKVQIAA